MNYFRTILLCLLVISMACSNKEQTSSIAVSDLDLKRGDIALCGNPEFGQLSFSLSCQVNSRASFDLALSLLHSFEYAEAEKAFVKVIDADPECAMAYWGVAMSLYHSLWAPPGKEELQKGAELLKIAADLPQSERAAAYIEALNAFYWNWETVDHDTRQKRYEKKMEAIYLNQKNDSEAAIFYALALRASADPSDLTFSKQKEAGELLYKLFEKQPNHPGIAHYIIHAYDYPGIANHALVTARRYAEIAPASAHAQHMPSHIFTRLGLWQESIKTNINSASSAVCYAQGSGNEGNWAQEIHAMDYLVYAYLQIGDNKKALEQYDYLYSMKKIFPLNHFAVAYTANAIPARIALENKNWEQASQLTRPALDFDYAPFHWEQSILHFARAMGFVRLGNVDTATVELNQLKSFHQNLKKDNSATATYKANQVLIEVKTVEAWLEYAKGNAEAAKVLMAEAVALESGTSKHPVTPGEVLPALQLQGDLLMELSDYQGAVAAYESDLIRHPNRFNSLYGLAVAHKKLGYKEEASNYFGQLLDLVGGVSSERKEIEEAKLYLNL